MNSDRFAARRASFLARLGQTVAIVPAAREQIRNDDVSYPFRQDSDFHFLTGFDEPDAVAVFDATADEPYTLFVRPSDPEAEAWTGRRVGVQGAVEICAADAAHPLGELRDWLRSHLSGRRTVGYVLDGRLDEDVLGAMRAVGSYAERSGAERPLEIVDIRAILHELRLVKSPDEIEALREACRISARAHDEAMRFAAPGRTERQVQAVLEYTFKVMGAERVGYGSIVAGGENACILHYVENDQPLADGDLLLIDAAAEYGHLTADITRTFPVNGRFSGPQRALYELVLRAQRAVIERCGPGLPFTDMHTRAVEVLSEGLVELGLLPGTPEEVVAMGWYRRFFFHGTGHWLGIDVHDVGSIRVDGGGRALEAGMAFTVEPGLYLARDKAVLTLSHAEYDPDERAQLAFELGADRARAEVERREAEAGSFEFAVPPEYLGLGVRIEDDLLVTAEGYENLSAATPVDPAAIEARCAEPSVLPVFD